MVSGGNKPKIDHHKHQQMARQQNKVSKEKLLSRKKTTSGWGNDEQLMIFEY